MLLTRSRIATAHQTDRDLPRVSVSGGVAQLRRGETLSELLRRADQASYQAKHSGRDRICMAAPILSESDAPEAFPEPAFASSGALKTGAAAAAPPIRCAQERVTTNRLRDIPNFDQASFIRMQLLAQSFAYRAGPGVLTPPLQAAAARRRPAQPSAANPARTIAQVPGSGTGAATKFENTPDADFVTLHAGPE